MKLWLALDILKTLAPCYACDVTPVPIDKKYIDELKALRLITECGNGVKRTELGEATVHFYSCPENCDDMDIDLAGSIPKKKKQKFNTVKSMCGYKFYNLHNDVKDITDKLAKKRACVCIEPEILDNLDRFCDALMLLEDIAHMGD